MSATTLQCHLADADATDALARALAGTQPGNAVVHLHGELGAGKSTLARAWLRALGVTGAIRSPTYTLVEHYRYDDPRVPGGGRALHLDLYRIGHAGELEFLGLDEAGATLWLVEWPEHGAGALPPADVRVELALAVGGGREARLEPGSEAGRSWLAGVEQSAGCSAF